MPGDDGDDELKKEARNTAIAVAASGIGAAVGGPLGAIVAPLLVGGTKLLWTETANWWETRSMLATNHLAAALELPEGEEEQQAAVAALLEDPVNSETILQAFQRMLDATAAAAWPCIAALTADYVREGKAVDGFFHDAVAVLASLDDQGLAAAEALFLKAESQRQMIGRGKRVTVNYNPPPRQDFTFTAPQELEGKEHHSPAPLGVQRALRILGANGFGQVRGDQITLGGEGEEDPCWRLLGYLRRREFPPSA